MSIETQNTVTIEQIEFALEYAAYLMVHAGAMYVPKMEN